MCSYTKTSPCTLDTGDEAPQLTWKEISRMRGTQDNSAGATTSWACVGFSLEKERVIQQSSVSIPLSFYNQGINLVGDDVQIT